VTSFSVACERDYPNKDTGEREVDFINCVAWRQTGEFVSKYFNKGSMIVVSGRLQIRSWTDDNCNKRTTAEVVAENVYFGGSKKDNSTETVPAGYTNVPYYNGTGSYDRPTSGTFDKYGIKPAVSDFALLDDDDAQLPF
jgi:single-strand DNA-binding protein